MVYSRIYRTCKFRGKNFGTIRNLAGNCEALVISSIKNKIEEEMISIGCGDSNEQIATRKKNNNNEKYNLSWSPQTDDTKCIWRSGQHIKTMAFVYCMHHYNL